MSKLIRVGVCIFILAVVIPELFQMAGGMNAVRANPMETLIGVALAYLLWRMTK